MALVVIPKSSNYTIERYEKISNSIQEILQKLGLTQNESKVYLYLIKNGSKKAKEIAKTKKFLEHKLTIY